MNKLKLYNLKLHEIMYLSRRNKKIKFKPFLFGFMAIIAITTLIICNYAIANVKNFVVSGNPVNPLYNDNSNVIFTGSDKVLNFILPIKGAKVDIEMDGSISFIIGSSIMITSCEDGIVDNVGYSLDGVKFVKIRHTDSIYSVVENVDIVGVGVNDIVKRGQDIATAKQGSKVAMRLYQDGDQIINIKIEQNKIIWTDLE